MTSLCGLCTKYKMNNLNTASLAKCIPLKIQSTALGLHPCTLCEYIYKLAGLLSQLY
jgi:hypothetical protein